VGLGNLFRALLRFFSIGLAFMNLLPIPGLDGGHALFTIVEMATGKL
jgi:membrane-associated protease RseP (regulator of RpoE activity)